MIASVKGSCLLKLLMMESKFTKQEIDEMKNIITKYRNVSGELSIFQNQATEIQKKVNQLENELLEIKSEENIIMNNLHNKYGEFSLQDIYDALNNMKLAKEGSSGSAGRGKTDKKTQAKKVTKAAASKVNSQAAADRIMDHYTTIAIFGVDSREQDLMAGDNRSDTMILCSIHKSTGKMKLISVYRDTWLELGDGSYGKANSAYAYGGPEQAVSMLNTNLDLDIDGFITIGFEGLADTIDSLGGIDLETGVTEEEAGYLNSYLEDMEYELGTDNEPVYTGQQHLSGIQAVAFARIRYTAGSDYRRTERQREVMKAILDRLKKAGPFGLAKAAKTVIGSSACSLTKTQMAGLILKAPFYSLDQSGGLPVEEYRAEDYIGEQACIIPDTLADNIRWLHASLYSQEDYQVSSEADAISSHIYESYHGY